MDTTPTNDDTHQTGLMTKKCFCGVCVSSRCRDHFLLSDLFFAIFCEGKGREGKVSFGFEEGFWFLFKVFVILKGGSFGPSEDF